MYVISLVTCRNTHFNIDIFYTVMDDLFIVLLISDWEGIQCIVIGNQFKLSDQLAIYLPHWTCPTAGHFTLRHHLYCFHHTIVINTY